MDIDSFCANAQTLEYPERKNALVKLAETTPERMMYELAKWIANDPEVLQDMSPKPDPELTDEVKEYRKLSPYEKGRMTHEYWINEGAEVKKYFDELWAARLHNRSNLYHIEEFLKYVPEEDVKVRTILETKQRQLKESNHVLPRKEDNNSRSSSPERVSGQMQESSWT